MKIAKCRTTNYRRQSTPGKTGLDYLRENQTREALDADAWVSGYSETALRGIARDLCATRDWDRRDPLQRWCMARKAAALRKLHHIPTRV
jgi:hypothetical protein